MITYKEICEANKTIKTTDIKGKDYAEVPQRIKAFRMLYPQGFICTDLISNDNGVCVFKASVGYYNEAGEPYVLGTGTAYEKEGSTFINKTSYIENCETSAVGRALGMAGYGIDAPVSSAEEVQNAIANQATEIHNDMMFRCEECGAVLNVYEGKDGKPVSIRKWAAGTTKTFGRVLCKDCVEKEKQSIGEIKSEA